MGKEDCSEQASSYSWWWDSHNLPLQSQWLQTTLSDLDKKIKLILNLIEEDGDSFVERAEVYHKKRPELIKLLEDLHRSYHRLAEKYDHLLSESPELAHSRLFSNSSKQAQQHLQISPTTSPENTKVVAPKSNPNPELETSNLDFEYLNRLADELVIPTEPSKDSKKKQESNQMWDELRLKTSKLMEGHLRVQAELIRRNDEKRKHMKALCIRVNRLMEENRALKSCLERCEIDTKPNRSPMSRMKGAILGKLLR